MLKHYLFTFLLLSGGLAFAQQVTTLVPSISTFNDGLALDVNGNIFASRYFGNTVTKITPDGQTSIFASGMSSPNGLVFDSLGNLIVPEATGGVISRFDTAGNKDTLFVINDPGAVAFDPDGNLIVARYNDNVISKVDSAGNVSDYWPQPGLNGPIGLLFDSIGNFYMGNFTDGKIYKRDLNDSITQLADLPGSMGFMTMAGGEIYATAFAQNRIYRVPLDASGAVLFSGSGRAYVDGHVSVARFDGPNGITSTSTGDTIYISEYNPRRLRMITGVLNPTVGLFDGHENADAFNTKVFPNPVQDHFFVEINSTLGGDLKAELFDQGWKSVQSWEGLDIEEGNDSYKFDLRNNNPGVYLLKLTHLNEVIWKKVLID